MNPPRNFPKQTNIPPNLPRGTAALNKALDDWLREHEDFHQGDFRSQQQMEIGSARKNQKKTK